MNRKSLALGLLASISVSGITKGMYSFKMPKGCAGFGSVTLCSFLASGWADPVTGLPGFSHVGMSLPEVNLVATVGVGLLGWAIEGNRSAAKSLSWLVPATAVFKLCSSDLLIGAIGKANVWHLGDAMDGSDACRYLLSGLVALGAYRVVTQTATGKNWQNGFANFFCGKLVTQPKAGAQPKAADQSELLAQL